MAYSPLFLSSFIIFGLVIIFWSSYVIVPQGFEYMKERFGKYQKTLTPGIHFLIPFVDQIAYKIDIKEIVLDISPQSVITKDNASVTADGVVFFKVHDSRQAAYHVQKLNTALQSLTMSNIRTVMGSMDLDEILSHREVINGQLLKVVNDATTVWGTEVTRIQIKDIHPPQDIVASMARQMKAEREKRAQILEAEGLRQSAILKAEGEKQSKILEAEGEQQAAILEATARKNASFLDAEARERLAKAEAYATDIISKSVKEGDSRALQYFISQKYVEAFHFLAQSESDKVIMMPYEATALISSLSGMLKIKEDIEK
jgi:regulator of protease activity HflC (stomatin/prohibitin superfamily)